MEYKDSYLTPDMAAASHLVAALEHAWAKIRSRHDEVPEVVLVVGRGETVRRRKLGHFEPCSWLVQGQQRHEVLIGAEGLDRGPVGVLSTLLHEAAHGLADTRGIQDTSRSGRYHNGRFRVLAEELGLHVDRLGSIGWSRTTVLESTMWTYTDTLTELKEALILYRRSIFERGLLQPVAASSRNYQPCICPCGRRIRVATSTLQAGSINCGCCGRAFIPEMLFGGHQDLALKRQPSRGPA